MNRFLFLSATGDGLGLALKLKDQGHTVAAWIKEKRSKMNYEGLLVKPRKWQDWITKDTVVVFDSSGGGKTGDRLRGEGYNVFMGSAFADQLELDRATGFEFMKQVGIKVPHSETFYGWEEGRAYAKRQGRLAFKPSGDFTHDPAVGSYVASDAEDMVEMLHYFEGAATHSPEFELQEFIEGVAISTEGWFDGQDWVYPFNQTVERKQLMDENLGGSGGCAGNAVWRCTKENKVILEGIKLMGPVLKEFGYVGPIDLNTVVNEEGVWALEFTPRFGYDALPAFLELFKGDIGEFICKLARKERVKDMTLDSGFGTALRVTVPPYPSEDAQHKGGVPVRGFERGDKPHLFLYDVMLDKRNRLVTSPAYGTVAAITGWGNTIHESLCEPYKLARAAKIPEKQFRTDLCEVLHEDYRRMQQWS